MQSSFEEISRHRSASFDVSVLVLADGPELAERVREAFGGSIRVHELPRGETVAQLDTSLKRSVTLVEVTPGTAEWDEWLLVSGSHCNHYPVALVSEETTASAVSEAFRAGVSDVLVEPLDGNRIRTAIERLLTRRSSVSHGAAAQRWAAAALAAVKPADEKVHPAVLLGRAVEQLIQLTSSPAGSAFLSTESGDLRRIPPFDARFEGHQLRDEEVEALRRAPRGDAVRFVPIAAAQGGHRWTLLSVPVHGFNGRRAVLALRVGEATRRRIQFERSELAFFADEIGRAWEASQLQRMIHAAKQEYESIVDSTTDYLLLLDPDFRIRRVNRATQQSLSRDFGEIIGRPFRELFPNVQPAKVGGPDVEGFLRRSIEGHPGARIEVRNLLEEGDTHEIRAYPGPSEPDGDVSVLFVKDVGDLRRMEYQLRQSEKLASLGTLAAGVAHEINNPVGYVKSNLGRLKEYIGEIRQILDEVRDGVTGEESPSDERLRALATQLRKDWEELDIDILLEDTSDIFTECFEGLEHVEVIVQNLKQYATKGGHQEPNLQIVHVAEGALRLVWNRLKYTINVVKKLEPTPPVRGSSVELMQVLVNLLVNAADATVDCKEHGRSPEVVIETREKDGGSLVVVSDNGQGISPEALDRIFDPFFTTKGPGKGTGLGLSISAEILNRHNAHIDVDSSPGEGTTFRIWFPASTSERLD